MKETIRRLVQNSPLASLGLAKIFAYSFAVPAFFLRLKWLGRAHLGRGVKFVGIRRIILGRNVSIGSGSWLNVNDRHHGDVALVIGDNSFVGRDNFFTVGERIVIREYCLTARNCAFIGSAHNYDDPFRPYSSTGTTLSDSIYVGVNCFFGMGSQIIGNVRIGHGSIIGAGAVVRSDVPPFSVVVGNPARIIRRYNFHEKMWIKCHDDMEIEGIPDEEVYLARLQERVPWVIHPISVAEAHRFDLP